jgi:hypothetical protein
MTMMLREKQPVAEAAFTPRLRRLDFLTGRQRRALAAQAYGERWQPRPTV